jgi:hypothetical protein
MALFDSFRSLIHDTAQGLIDANVTTKVSEMVTNFVSSGLSVTNDTLKIVRDITVPPPPPPPGP